MGAARAGDGVQRGSVRCNSRGTRGGDAARHGRRSAEALSTRARRRTGRAQCGRPTTSRGACLELVGAFAVMRVCLGVVQVRAARLRTSGAEEREPAARWSTAHRLLWHTTTWQETYLHSWRLGRACAAVERPALPSTDSRRGGPDSSYPAGRDFTAQYTPMGMRVRRTFGALTARERRRRASARAPTAWPMESRLGLENEARRPGLARTWLVQNVSGSRMLAYERRNARGA